MHLREQGVGQGRRADRHVVHAAKIEPLDEIALAHHQCIHGRDPGQKSATVASHGLEEAARVETRQQYNLHAVRERDGDIEQSVHVIQRRHHEGRIAGRFGRYRFDVAHGRPELAAVGERHALRHARRTGGVENLRQRVLVGHEGFERAGIQEGIPSVGTRAVELDHRHRIRHERPARRVAQGEFDGAVAENVGNGRARQFVVDRYRDRSPAHDAKVAGDELEPVLREYADAGARPDTAALKAAAHGIAQCIKFERRELLRARFVAQIDDGAALAIRRKLQNVSEVVNGRMLLAHDGHGLSNTLPTTSRSSSRRSASAVSSSGNTLSMTGARRPPATSSIRVLRSSVCQPLEPISSCS